MDSGTLELLGNVSQRAYRSQNCFKNVIFWFWTPETKYLGNLQIKFKIKWNFNIFVIFDLCHCLLNLKTRYEKKTLVFLYFELMIFWVFFLLFLSTSSQIPTRKSTFYSYLGSWSINMCRALGTYKSSLKWNWLSKSLTTFIPSFTQIGWVVPTSLNYPTSSNFHT